MFIHFPLAHSRSGTFLGRANLPGLKAMVEGGAINSGNFGNRGFRDVEGSTPRSGCYLLLEQLLKDTFIVKKLSTTPSGVAKGLRKQLQLDAMWVSSDDDSPFSFMWVCQHLNVDPTKIRRAYFSESEEQEKIAA